MGLLLSLLFGSANKAALKRELQNKTSDQQQIIHYFLDGRGCLKKGIPDSEFDANKIRQIKALNLKQRALNKLGIDEDQVKVYGQIPRPFYE